MRAVHMIRRNIARGVIATLLLTALPVGAQNAASGYPKGLVRYSTQNAMDNKWTPSQMWRRLMRPRVQIYTMILVAVTVGLFVSISMRLPFKVDVVRDRSSLSRITEYGTLENVYRLQIMNASEVEQIYRLGVKGLPDLKITTETQISVAPAQARWVVLSADIPYGSAQAGSHKIELEVEALGIGHAVLEKSVFIVPR